MIDHALAAPVFHIEAELAEFGGMGSQLQRNAPVRASKARTTPLDMSTLELSLMAEPTITRSSTTAGGDVMWYCPGIYLATSLRLTPRPRQNPRKASRSPHPARLVARPASLQIFAVAAWTLLGRRFAFPAPAPTRSPHPD